MNCVAFQVNFLPLISIKYILVFEDPSDEFPSGLVYTGCQDGKIRAFLPDIEDPLFLLEGHEENITSIFVGK